MERYLKKLNLNRGRWQKSYILCITLFSSFAVLAKAIIPSHEDALGLTNGLSNPLLIFIAKMRIYLEKNPSLGFCVFALIFLFYLHFERNNKKIDITVYGLSSMLALIMLVGMSIKQYGDLTFLYSNYFQIVISTIIWIGYMIFFSRVIQSLFDLMDQRCSKSWCDESDQSIKLELAKTFVLLLICWFPYWLAYFPGSVMWDPYLQFDQYFGVFSWSDWHPVFSTVLYGFLMSLGRNIANDNCGIFLCALYQHMLLAGSVSYGMYILNKWRINRKVRLSILAFFCFHPLIAFQAQSVMKDVSYFAFILCFSITYLDILRDMSNRENVTCKKYILLVVMAILSSLMRHNGIYCCLLSIVALLFKSSTRKNKFQILAIMASVIFISGFISNSIISYTNASSKSQGEMMSIPFQQIARYVKYHGDELTEEDKQTIDGVLQYDSLAEKYNPEISDPVKNDYKYTRIDTKFLNVWMKCFIKHPKEYFEAFFCNTYTYYYPDGDSNSKPMVYNTICDDAEVNTGYFDITYVSNESVRNAFENILYMLKDLPGVGILFRQGFYTWLILAYCTYVRCKKIECGLIASVPLMVHFLTCIASPVNGYFRYYMPIIFIIPFVLVWTVQCHRNLA